MTATIATASQSKVQGIYEVYIVRGITVQHEKDNGCTARYRNSSADATSRTPEIMRAFVVACVILTLFQYTMNCAAE